MKNILIIFIFIPIISFSQKIIPLSFSVYNESTTLPFTRFVTFPVHPGIEIGSELDLNKKTEFGFYQTLNLSYFYHQHLNQGIAIYTETEYKQKIIKNITISFLIGLGYLHTFATTEEFVFENGSYYKARDWGNARLYPSISLKLGYKIRNNEIFIKYQTWLEYPYSPDFIPVMTHNNLHLGLKFYLKNNL